MFTGAMIVVVASTLPLPEMGHHHRAVAYAIVGGFTLVWLLALIPAARPVAACAGLPTSLLTVTALVGVTGGLQSPYTSLFGAHLVYGALFLTRRSLLAYIALLVGLLALTCLKTISTSSPKVLGAHVVTTLALWTAVCVALRLLRRELIARRGQADGDRQRYQSLFSQSPTATYTLDTEGRIVAVNDAMIALARRPAEQLLASTHSELLSSPDDSAPANRAVDAALQGHAQTVETTLNDPTGKAVSLRITVLPVVVNGDIEGVHVTAVDISEVKALHARLRRQALHDPLTGLPNRRLLNDRLTQALAAEQRAGRPLSLLLMDLDGFKQVNDTLGHHAGDQVLARVSTRITECLRPSDTLARLGGDEFVCLLPDTDAAGANQVEKRITNAMTAPLQIGDQHVDIGISIGAASTDGSRTGPGPDALIAAADRAMYTVKRQRSTRSR